MNNNDIKLSEEYQNLSLEYLNLGQEYEKLNKNNTTYINLAKKYNNLSDEFKTLELRKTENKGTLTLSGFLLLVLVISLIPIVGSTSIIASSSIFTIVLMFYNYNLMKNGLNRKAVLHTILSFILYYLISSIQTFTIYGAVLSQISHSLPLQSSDVDFRVLSIKVLILIIPILISSFICSKFNKFSNILLKLFIIINILLFYIILK